MKKRKMLSAIGLLLIMILTMTACGKKAEDKSSDSRINYDSYGSMTEEETAEAPAATDSSENQSTSSTGSIDLKSKNVALGSASAITAKDPVVQSQDKIIRRFNLDVETQEFDSLITKIDAEIDRLGGYVENSKISGKPFYYNEDARYGSIVVRIPRDKVDEFVSSVNEKANVVNKEESTENVTLQYTDMESRKKSLEIEQERLFALLEKTDTLENIVTLESRLSDIRYQLQNYETQLRTYDNQVEYSTVTLSIQEVERITPVTEEKQTVAQRIKNGFSDTVFDISEGVKNFFVWFVVNLPYLLIWTVIIAAVILITRRYLKKKAKDIPASPQRPNPPMDVKK